MTTIFEDIFLNTKSLFTKGAKKVVTTILNRSLGKFFDGKLQSFQVSNDLQSIRNIRLDVDVLNNVTDGLPIVFLNASIGLAATTANLQTVLLGHEKLTLELNDIRLDVSPHTQKAMMLSQTFSQSMTDSSLYQDAQDDLTILGEQDTVLPVDQVNQFMQQSISLAQQQQNIVVTPEQEDNPFDFGDSDSDSDSDSKISSNPSTLHAVDEDNVNEDGFVMSEHETSSNDFAEADREEIAKKLDEIIAATEVTIKNVEIWLYSNADDADGPALVLSLPYFHYKVEQDGSETPEKTIYFRGLTISLSEGNGLRQHILFSTKQSIHANTDWETLTQEQLDASSDSFRYTSRAQPAEPVDDNNDDPLLSISLLLQRFYLSITPYQALCLIKVLGPLYKAHLHQQRKQERKLRKQEKESSTNTASPSASASPSGTPSYTQQPTNVPADIDVSLTIRNLEVQLPLRYWLSRPSPQDSIFNLTVSPFTLNTQITFTRETFTSIVLYHLMLQHTVDEASYGHILTDLQDNGSEVYDGDSVFLVPELTDDAQSYRVRVDNTIHQSIGYLDSTQEQRIANVLIQYPDRVRMDAVTTTSSHGKLRVVIEVFGHPADRADITQNLEFHLGSENSSSTDQGLGSPLMVGMESYNLTVVEMGDQAAQSLSVSHYQSISSSGNAESSKLSFNVKQPLALTMDAVTLNKMQTLAGNWSDAASDILGEVNRIQSQYASSSSSSSATPSPPSTTSLDESDGGVIATNLVSLPSIYLNLLFPEPVVNDDQQFTLYTHRKEKLAFELSDIQLRSDTLPERTLLSIESQTANMSLVIGNLDRDLLKTTTDPLRVEIDMHNTPIHESIVSTPESSPNAQSSTQPFVPITQRSRSKTISTDEDTAMPNRQSSEHVRDDRYTDVDMLAILDDENTDLTDRNNAAEVVQQFRMLAGMTVRVESRALSLSLEKHEFDIITDLFGAFTQMSSIDIAPTMSATPGEGAIDQRSESEQWERVNDDADANHQEPEDVVDVVHVDVDLSQSTNFAAFSTQDLDESDPSDDDQWEQTGDEDGSTSLYESAHPNFFASFIESQVTVERDSDSTMAVAEDSFGTHALDVDDITGGVGNGMDNLPSDSESSDEFQSVDAGSEDVMHRSILISNKMAERTQVIERQLMSKWAQDQYRRGETVRKTRHPLLFQFVATDLHITLSLEEPTKEGDRLTTEYQYSAHLSGEITSMNSQFQDVRYSNIDDQETWGETQTRSHLLVAFTSIRLVDHCVPNVPQSLTTQVLLENTQYAEMPSSFPVALVFGGEHDIYAFNTLTLNLVLNTKLVNNLIGFFTTDTEGDKHNDNEDTGDKGKGKNKVAGTTDQEHHLSSLKLSTESTLVRCVDLTNVSINYEPVRKDTRLVVVLTHGKVDIYDGDETDVRIHLDEFHVLIAPTKELNDCNDQLHDVETPKYLYDGSMDDDDDDMPTSPLEQYIGLKETQLVRTTNPTPESPRCAHCQQVGHLIDQCPDSDKERVKFKCKFCHGPEHGTTKCPFQCPICRLAHVDSESFKSPRQLCPELRHLLVYLWQMRGMVPVVFVDRLDLNIGTHSESNRPGLELSLPVPFEVIVNARPDVFSALVNTYFYLSGMEDLKDQRQVSTQYRAMRERKMKEDRWHPLVKVVTDDRENMRMKVKGERPLLRQPSRFGTRRVVGHETMLTKADVTAVILKEEQTLRDIQVLTERRFDLTTLVIDEYDKSTMVNHLFEKAAAATERKRKEKEDEMSDSLMSQDSTISDATDMSSVTLTASNSSFDLLSHLVVEEDYVAVQEGIVPKMQVTMASCSVSIRLKQRPQFGVSEGVDSAELDKYELVIGLRGIKMLRRDFDGPSREGYHSNVQFREVDIALEHVVQHNREATLIDDGQEFILSSMRNKRGDGSLSLSSSASNTSSSSKLDSEVSESFMVDLELDVQPFEDEENNVAGQYSLEVAVVPLQLTLTRRKPVQWIKGFVPHLQLDDATSVPLVKEMFLHQISINVTDNGMISKVAMEEFNQKMLSKLSAALLPFQDTQFLFERVRVKNSLGWDGAMGKVGMEYGPQIGMSIASVLAPVKTTVKASQDVTEAMYALMRAAQTMGGVAQRIWM
eukprot:TRINITY_DN1055_c0_g4_i2.p1 TRINITY_DN1055_c0_g4~~TRINITY_DN1055_c0_g4_i2.p1  ORF type:complete len:2117 (+),score=687.37 TRINITY_DN1055_c0_g4_i2:42-6353(+)